MNFLEYRRLASAIVALIVGIAVAVIAATPAQAYWTTPNAKGYCEMKFPGYIVDGTPSDRNNAYSWRCVIKTPQGWMATTQGIDMNRACAFATPNHVGDAHLDDPHNAYSWWCFY